MGKVFWNFSLRQPGYKVFNEDKSETRQQGITRSWSRSGVFEDEALWKGDSCNTPGPDNPKLDGLRP